MKTLSFILISIVLLAGCTQKTKNSDTDFMKVDTLQGISLLGKELIVNQLDPARDSLRILNYLLAKKQSIDNPDNADALIWFGRRTAYLGDYKRAIEIFTEGIEKFPNDARMYRHRGHRFISLRKFDNAITDLEEATRLIEGKPDEVEPDGIPNIRNTPVSSLQNNIWYHLGLAYYLKNDMDKALDAFSNCLEVATNPDMQVATSHWLYMILRRLEENEEAEKILIPITKDLDVFENMAYHQLCLLYKGQITEDKLITQNQSANYMNDAIAYGLGNWYYYNGNPEKAKEIYKNLLDLGSWAAFGYIAAEADMSRWDSARD